MALGTTTDLSPYFVSSHTGNKMAMKILRQVGFPIKIQNLVYFLMLYFILFSEKLFKLMIITKRTYFKSLVTWWFTIGEPLTFLIQLFIFFWIVRTFSMFGQCWIIQQKLAVFNIDNKGNYFLFSILNSKHSDGTCP